ncbi:MAG: DUF4065 domain-containing protein [bacterium]|nr:DUF4065 domain-containing protein [bacterium]
MNIIDKKVGNTVKLLRDQAGMSQHDLSEEISVSRPTLSQIENGERKLTPEELRKLAKIFNVSIDILLDIEEEPIILLEKMNQQKNDPENSKSAVRISVPQKKIGKFKEVLLYILNCVGSKPNVGETVIYKLLYFMDFDYYELYEEQFIGATYVKNHYGPTPLEYKKIVDQMIVEQEIEKVESEYFSYPQTKYLPLRRANMDLLNAKEIVLIDSILNRLSDMSASKISDYSHGDVPWQVTEMGSAIDYESVFYRTEDYSVREYDRDEL